MKPSGILSWIQKADLSDRQVHGSLGVTVSKLYDTNADPCFIMTVCVNVPPALPPALFTMYGRSTGRQDDPPDRNNTGAREIRFIQYVSRTPGSLGFRTLWAIVSIPF